MSLKERDLENLIRPKIHVDEYQSKMGKDEDIVTISFKCKYKDPAADLVNYLEKGYDWVLDADLSTGTVSDGSWIVFIEAARRPSLSIKLYNLLDDLKSVTLNPLNKYTFRYKKDTKYKDFSVEEFNDTVPLTPREYRRRNKSQELSLMLNAAGVKNSAKGKFSPDVQEFANLAKYR